MHLSTIFKMKNYRSTPLRFVIIGDKMVLYLCDGDPPVWDLWLLETRLYCICLRMWSFYKRFDPPLWGDGRHIILPLIWREVFPLTTMGTSCIGPEKEDSPIQIQILGPPVGKSGNMWLFTFLSKLIHRLSGHFWVKFKEEVIDKDSILLQSLWNKNDPSELMLSFNPLMFCKQCWISSVICWKLLTCGTIWLVLLIHWWNLFGNLLWYGFVFDHIPPFEGLPVIYMKLALGNILSYI